MFDYLRNLSKSSEEKRQEMLTAYVDGELSPQDVQQFEALMVQDSSLQAEVEAQQLLQQRMQLAARRRAPRSFTLDPAVYGVPESPSVFERLFGGQPSGSATPALARSYPVLQTATVLAALMLFLVLGLDLVGNGRLALESGAGDAEIAVVEVTRVVTETEALLEDTAEIVKVTREVDALTAADEAADDGVGASDSPAGQSQTFAAPEELAEAEPTKSALPREQDELELRAEAVATVEPTVLPAEEAVAANQAVDDGGDEAVSEEAADEAQLEADSDANRFQTLAEPVSPWRIWQIILLAIFIILLLATLFVRWRIR
ncbi:MAG: hypothetical protein AAF614_03985 [Chloroflexota bacterium]